MKFVECVFRCAVALGILVLVLCVLPLALLTDLLRAADRRITR